ncbi:unnamed protein product [Effrenium voratum]|nr:unnamed protein product [Effrenium voratum]
MPDNSPSVKVSAVRDTYGAEVRFCKPTQEAREAMSAAVVAELRAKHGEERAEEIHPNQDVRVVNGQGSVAMELLEQQPDLDALVVSIGGGGLIGGVATYAKSVNSKIKIIGAEPECAKSAFMSKKAGHLVTNPPNAVIDTIADSVKSSLGPTTYPLVRDLVDDVFTASEQEIEDATKFMMERAKQAKIQLPRFCKDLNVANLSHSQAASLPFMCQNGTFDFGVQGAPFPSLALLVQAIRHYNAFPVTSNSAPTYSSPLGSLQVVNNRRGHVSMWGSCLAIICLGGSQPSGSVPF